MPGACLSRGLFERKNLPPLDKVRGCDCRWQTGRVRPAPSNKLSDEERAQILSICNSEDLASLPSTQSVQRLADQGRYVALGSSFSHVYHRDHDQLRHRGLAEAPVRRHKTASSQATGPNQVWSCEFDPVCAASNDPVDRLT